MTGRSFVLATAAGLILIVAGAQPARADDRDRYGYRDNDRYHDNHRECERKIDKEQHKLDKEVRNHGWRSRQAERQREKIARLRYECRSHSRYGYGRGDWRDDNRRRWGRWDHDPFQCRHYNHRHDRDGGFRWGGTFWLRLR